MSMDYWPILGYGVCLVEDMIDRSKAASLMGIPEEDVVIEELLVHLCELPEGKPLTWASTGEMYDEPVYFLYCPAVLPWAVPGSRWEGISAEQVAEAIRSLLTPVLKEGVQLPQPEDICEVGCG